MRSVPNSSKSFRRILALLALAIALPLPVAAQTYPDHPIKMILPFPPGSATDGVARFIAEDLRKSLGQAVVVENQAGADGIIAAQNAKRAAPDGYTIFLTTNSSHGVNPAIYKELPYDPEKDFEAIGGIMRIPQLLVVKKEFPADDVAGFVRVAKERAAAGTAKGLSYATGNTSSRVAAELLKSAAKIDMIDVPYRGTPQALQDLVGGQVDLFFSDPFAAAGFITAGTVKALAVTDSTRVPLLPNVPTMAEAGFKDVHLVSWAAAFVPAKTDPAIVAKLNKAINDALAKKETKDYLLKMGATPLPMSPAEQKDFVHSEIARWAKLAEMAKIPKK